MATTCPVHCDASTPPNVLPFLRFIWDHPSAIWKFTQNPTRKLLHSDRHYTADEDEHEGEDEEEDEDGETPRLYKSLSRMLLSLGQSDDLQLKRFARSEVHLKEVLTDRNRAKGSVVYYSSRRVPHVVCRFEASSDGTVQWRPHQKPVQPWNSLPLKIQEEIQILATTSADGLFVDINSRTVRGLDFSLFKVAKMLFRSAYFVHDRKPRAFYVSDK
jgi:hypothetical protein